MVRVAARGAGKKRVEDTPPEPDWEALWAFGRVSLGLADGEFWELTAREFAALKRQRERERREAFLPSAVVAATIANCHRDPRAREEAFTPADFMPADPEAPDGALSPEATLEAVRQLAAAMGAKQGQ